MLSLIKTQSFYQATKKPSEKELHLQEEEDWFNQEHTDSIIQDTGDPAISSQTIFRFRYIVNKPHNLIILKRLRSYLSNKHNMA